MAGQATNTTIDPSTNFTTTEIGDNKTEMRIVSSLVVVVVLILACVIGYLLYKKICRSHHEKYKHGVERDNPRLNSKGRVEYYDQFGCDVNELTVNSVTAITWDEDERAMRKAAVAATGSKSSGIDCDTNSDEGKEVQINTGKRVFQVNKVSERAVKRSPTSGRVVIRIHKGIADAARSLQASDGNNYALAIIDKNTQTVHNIDLGRGRGATRTRSPLVSDNERPPQKVGSNGRRRKLRNYGDSQYETTSSSNDEMIHDSPDLGRKVKVSTSVDELARESSNSSDARSESVSSGDFDNMESTVELLPSPDNEQM